MIHRLFRAYYFFKFYPFRGERRQRRARGPGRGFVGIQIDGLSHPHLQQALAAGYLPHLSRFLKHGFVLREYEAGLPSTTPAAQGCIFFGDGTGIPAFRWYEKSSGRLISCNDVDHVQYFRNRLFEGRPGLLEGGASYANILDGGAARSIFTVSSPRPQTLFGRVGGRRLALLLCLHPLRTWRMLGATVVEYLTNHAERRHFLRTRPWKISEGLFPFIRIFCNVILRELQTFGVIADIYAGVPCIYTTYSGYDELAHHFGPGSRPALKSLKHIDLRLGEIMRMLRHAPGADYELVILSDHGQTPGIPFRDKFGATLGETISQFLREHQTPAVSSGPLEFTRVQLGYLREELAERPPGWRQRLYRRAKDWLQGRIQDLVPETTKVDPQGGVVVTYSSSLAHLYITGKPHRLCWREIEREHPRLLRFLSQHPGIGFLMARGEGDDICFFHARGSTTWFSGSSTRATSLAFLRPYGDPQVLLPELLRFAADPAAGDLIVFGAYDGNTVICFDDQVGGHGSAGGEQSRPFLILPQEHPLLRRERLSGHAFLYHEVFQPLRAGSTPGR